MAIALYTHRDMLRHEPHARNPERPERLAAVTAALAESGVDLEPREAPLAARADLERAHGADYLDAIARAVPDKGLIRLDPDTWMSPGSLKAAGHAAGGAIAAARAVAAGEIQRAFCAVRPPGHHAGPGFAMGFCIYSNIALAARAAQDAGLGRIAVADFDVHHGNGTQAVFEADPNLFLASVHQMPLYPGSGGPEETGVGNIANAAVAPGAPRETWRRAFEGLMARMDAFAPDMILISAGFDAHARDPLAQQSLEAEDFAWATRAIVSVAELRCGGRIVSSLEGGYDLQGLAMSAAAHVAALDG
jgi:acetoin utilization deacetylase AcuC-like enzyme